MCCQQYLVLRGRMTVRVQGVGLGTVICDGTGGKAGRVAAIGGEEGRR